MNNVGYVFLSFFGLFGEQSSPDPITAKRGGESAGEIVGAVLDDCEKICRRDNGGAQCSRNAHDSAGGGSSMSVWDIESGRWLATRGGRGVPYGIQRWKLEFG